MAKDHKTGTDQINTKKQGTHGGRMQTCLRHKPARETRKQPLPEVSDNGLERGDRALPTLLRVERWEGRHQVDPESTRPSLNPSSDAPLGESLKSCWTLVSTCLYYSLAFYFLPECS